ncbi:unnamed protein product [Phyllotreta striolata]|uniref:Uncharacterized protein n=1 Tax=Phyllotreta striolata TaxID=444603 RepID=A0A9N9XMH0_PHYSR|nr:unnamed protein product [Phyllotreta striolata]
MWVISRATPVDLDYDNSKKVITKNPNQHPLGLHNSNQQYTSICWAESLIITENKHTKNQTVSKSYSIILDTPEKLQQMHNEDENVTCVEILERNSKVKEQLNFTTLREDEDSITKERKRSFCGAGPVLSHHFIVWPKLNRRQIEISINPLSSTKWKHCQDAVGDDVDDKIELNSTPKRNGGKTRSVAEDGEEISDGTFEEAPASKAKNKVGAAHGGGRDEVVGLPEPELKPPARTTPKPKPKPKRTPKNSVTNRRYRCPQDLLSMCSKMLAKSDNLLGHKNSKEAVFGKWFFLNSTDVKLDSDLPFKMKIKMIVIVESVADEKKRSKLILEEESLFYPNIRKYHN